MSFTKGNAAYDADGNPIDLNLDSAAALGASLLEEANALPEGTDAEAEAAIDEAAALLSVDAHAPNTDIPDLPDTTDSGTIEPAEGTALPGLAGGAADTSSSFEELAGTADLSAPDPIDTVDMGTETGTSADSVPDLDGVPLTEVADATPAGSMAELGSGLDDVPSADAAEDAPEAIPEVESAPEFYAPPVPDAAVTIAQEMDNAIQP